MRRCADAWWASLPLCDVTSRRVRPQVYNKVPVSSVLKFGASTRLYVVHGPESLLPPEETRCACAATRM